MCVECPGPPLATHGIFTPPRPESRFSSSSRPRPLPPHLRISAGLLDHHGKLVTGAPLQQYPGWTAAVSETRYNTPLHAVSETRQDLIGGRDIHIAPSACATYFIHLPRKQNTPAPHRPPTPGRLRSIEENAWFSVLLQADATLAGQPVGVAI